MSNALHIFAATDHSPQGNFAVARAFALAALEHSPLQLLQVLNQSLLQRLQELLGQEGDLLQEQLHGDARQRLQTLAEQLDQGQSQRVECHVLHGSVVGSLLEHLQQHPCDLLVLGAQGENALRHLLLGSTAARLLNHCREPLLVADSTPSGHTVHAHPAGHSTHIWPSVPRPFGQAVGAQRRRDGIVIPRCPASSIYSPVYASIRP